MQVKVLYFAILRDAANCAEETFELKEQATSKDLHMLIKEKYPSFLDLSGLRVAVNEECV